MVHLDYVWIDGLEAPLIRSKTKIVKEFSGVAPLWNYDGSSTQQATTADSRHTMVSNPTGLDSFLIPSNLI